MTQLLKPNNRIISIAGGHTGGWEVLRAEAVTGDGLPEVRFLDFGPPRSEQSEACWRLLGAIGSARYLHRDERQSLVAVQPVLGRSEASMAAFIAIRKTEPWWALAQDERREIFERRSKHIEISSRYLPAIARGLFHCRDLTVDQGFDFLAWFEFAPEHAPDFDDLLASLRATEEWKYVDREIEFSLVRA